MKMCSKCNEFKNLADFHKDARLLDGHHSLCKVCRNTSAKSYQKQYESQHKAQILMKKSKRNKIRRMTDLNFKLKHNLRNRLSNALKNNAKSNKTLILIGCSLEQLKMHLEKQFQTGMNWSNYGKKIGQWNIDHIIPCASFDLKYPEQQQKCFHFTNLQPLWAIDNLKKSSRVL